MTKDEIIKIATDCDLWEYFNNDPRLNPAYTELQNNRTAQTGMVFA